MKKFLISLLCVCGLAANADAAILCKSPIGTPPVVQATLADALAASGCIDVSVTSPLTAVQSNISSAAVHGWPAARTLRVESGGSINPSTRFRLLRPSGTIAAEMFGVKGDGITDDTAALIRAMRAAYDSDKILSVKGHIVFKRSTAGAALVQGCSMVGEGITKLSIDGTVGFNLSGVAAVTLKNLNVEVTNSYLTDKQPYVARYIFYHNGTGALSVNVDNLRFYFDTAGDSTGASRGGTCMEFSGASRVSVANVKAINIAQGIRVFFSQRVAISEAEFSNFETGVYLSTCSGVDVSKIKGINTRLQSHVWIGKNYSTPSDMRGHDLMLQENCDRVTVSGGYCEWPIERMFYLQSSNMIISDCLCVNGSGYKLVGYNRDSRAVHVKAVNCHVKFTGDYTAADGTPTGFTSYWVDDIVIDACSVIGSTAAGNIVESFMTIGYMGTVGNLTIKNCYAKYVSVGLLYVYLLNNDLQSSYIVADGFQLINNIVEKSAVRSAGSFLTFGTGSATAAARATYAARNGLIRGNKVIMQSGGSTRDDFFYQIKYIAGLEAANNSNNLPFVGGLIPDILAPATDHYAAIFLNEPRVTVQGGAGSALIAKLGLLEVLKGSKINFVSTGAGFEESYLVTCVITGKLIDGIKEFTMNRVGAASSGPYWAYGAGMTGIVEVTAPTGRYVGKVSGATLTDISNTSPVTLKASSGNFIIRGDTYNNGAFTVKIKFN